MLVRKIKVMIFAIILQMVIIYHFKKGSETMLSFYNNSLAIISKYEIICMPFKTKLLATFKNSVRVL